MPAMPNRWKPNVTVAALIEREGRFLLVEEETTDGLKLNNPAGHLDPGESPEQACAREVLEEAVKLERITGTYIYPPFGNYEAVLRVLEGIDRF